MDIQKFREEYVPLYWRIVRAVAETMPERAGEVDKALSSYHGNPRLLGMFLTTFGSDNPWLASLNAHLRTSMFDVPKEAKTTAETTEAVQSEIVPKKIKERKKKLLGKSVSGHFLTQQLFVVENIRNTIQTWTSGFDALGHILELFGTEEQKEGLTPEGKKRIKQREEARDFVQTLEEVLIAPERITDVQSINDRHRVRHILNLDDEIYRRLALLDRLMLGDTAFVEKTSELYLLAREPGGMFLTWFKKQDKLDRLPDKMREAYLTAAAPESLLLPSEERQRIFASLFAYASAHMPVRAEAAIGGYQKDLTFVMGLPDSDPIIQCFGRPILLGIEHILSQPEITLIDATRIFDAYPIDKVRKEINKAYAAQHEEEIARAVSSLERLFMKGGQWLEDAMVDSVPMGRVKKSIYYLALSREDFRSVARYLKLRTLAPGERLYQAMALSDWKKLVDDVRVASRKLNYLNAEMAKHGIAVTNPEEAEETVREYESTIRRDSKLALVENFAAAHGLPLEEFVKRMDKLGRDDATWRRERPQFMHLTSFDLYSEKIIGSIEATAKYIKAHKPQKEMEADIARAIEVSNHQFVIYTNRHFPKTESEYVKPEEQKSIAAHLAAGEEIRKMEAAIAAASPESLHSLLARREQLKHAFFYSIVGGHVVPQTYGQEAEPKKMFPDTCVMISVLDIEKLPEHLERLVAEFVPHTNLPEYWVRKAEYVARKTTGATGATSATGVRWALPEIWNHLQRPDAAAYVHNSLIQAVEEEFAKIQPVVTYDSSVLVEVGETFEQGALLDKYGATILGAGLRIQQGYEFRMSFRDFVWVAKSGDWRVQQPVMKDEAGEITQRVARYNKKHGTALRVRVEKV